MSFDWAGYLDFAESLCANTADESALRTATSRAYYASYHAAVRYVRTYVGAVETDGPTSHDKVWGALKSAKQRSAQRAGVHGPTLKKSRKAADYDNQPAHLLVHAQEAVRHAKLIIDHLAAGAKEYESGQR